MGGFPISNRGGHALAAFSNWMVREALKDGIDKLQGSPLDLHLSGA